MNLLRGFLVLGLVIHKVVWEVLKRKQSPLENNKKTNAKLQIRLVKLIKSIVLIFLVVQTLFLDVLPISEQASVLRIFGVLLYSIGLVVAITGRIQLGSNWADLEDYQVRPEQSVVSNGIYRYIRHPIYTGDLLLITGLELALNSWLVLGVIFVLVVVVRQALAEEALLSRSLPGYADYRSQTKMLIPFVF